MRRLIVTPWDLAAIDQVVTLQKDADLFLMTASEERDYFEEFNPKDWYFLRNDEGHILGFIRHFPHFSTSSWLQFVARDEVSSEDLEFVWKRFIDSAFLEEADGFQFHQRRTDSSKISDIILKSGFNLREQRTWFRHSSIEFGVSTLKEKFGMTPSLDIWNPPTGFKAALLATNEDSFLTTQGFSPFQERVKMWSNEEANSVIRFDQRDREIFICADGNLGESNLCEAIANVVSRTSCDGVWSTSQLPVPCDKSFNEIIYSFKK